MITCPYINCSQRNTHVLRHKKNFLVFRKIRSEYVIAAEIELLDVS